MCVCVCVCVCVCLCVFTEHEAYSTPLHYSIHMIHVQMPTHTHSYLLMQINDTFTSCRNYDLNLYVEISYE